MGIFLLGITAVEIAVIAAISTAALVVILFVLLELTLADCRTEISSYTFNF